MYLKLFMVVLLTVFNVYAREEDVLELTDSDFTDKLSSHETVLVMFYAPWCGHCKRLKPEYAKAAESLLLEDPPIILAKVDCTEGGKDTCGQFSVTGYPTLKIFKNGDFSQDYNGPREAGGIVKYMKAQTGPASKDLTSVADFDTFRKVQETSIIGFFKKDSELKSTFLKYADKYREKLRFAHTSDEQLLNKYSNDDIYIFRATQFDNKFEPNMVKYTGGASLSALTTFVKENFHGIAGFRTRENVQDFENPNVIAYYEIDYVKNPKGTNYWRNRILKVAKDFSGPHKFAISSKDDFQNELNEYGLDYTGDKPVILARDAKNLKYKMDGEFSVADFEIFLKKLNANELEPYIKSEPIPENNDGPVKIAVGKNYDELVTNNNKDTLIEFYAPWCGHCKKLTPIYDELGEKMKDEDIAIVKMDATANDVPSGLEVRGFPTLYWLPKNAKDDPIKYEGGRELNDFIKYISKQSTNELHGYDRSGNVKKIEKNEL